MFVEETLYQIHTPAVTVLTTMTNSHVRPGAFRVAASYHFELLVSTFIRPGTRSLLTAGIVPYLLLQRQIQALT